MRTIIIVILSLVMSLKGFGQVDTLPPYKQIPLLPPFKIILADSTWFTKSNLATKKPTLMLYFSPDCGHCQLETEDIISKINSLKNLQIIMITSKPYQDMLDFSNYFKLERFANIKVGTDPNRFITNFYAVKTTPFSALYDKKGKLTHVWDKGINYDQLIKAVK